METLTYVELVQKQTVLVRARNTRSFNNKIKQLNLSALLSRSDIRIVDTITNIKKPIGTLFEGTI